MIFGIVSTAIGLVFLGCVMKQHLEIKRLLAERKKLVGTIKRDKRNIKELTRDLFGAESERDILQCGYGRLEAELKKSEGLCERLWKSNSELLQGGHQCTNTTCENAIPSDVNNLIYSPLSS